MSQLNRAWRGITKLSTRKLPERLLAGVPADVPTHVLGEGEGSWRIPVALPEGAICYCIGVGLQASFDEALANECRAEVHCFDPTPTSIEYMRAHPELPVRFHPVGIWNKDTEMTLYRQAPGDDINLTLVDPGEARGGRFGEARFQRLSTVMGELGHSRIDLLKLDVEGAWYEILDDMLASGIVPDIVCVDFDSPVSPFKVWRMARRLRKAGLHYVSRDIDDYLFVKT